MRNYFIYFIFIFLLSCSFNEDNEGVTNFNLAQNEINDFEQYSFEEYVNLLLNNNKSKSYPDINNITD